MGKEVEFLGDAGKNKKNAKQPKDQIGTAQAKYGPSFRFSIGQVGQMGVAAPRHFIGSHFG